MKAIIALIIISLLSLPVFAWEVPTIIDFQGKLTDNNNNAQAGEFNMTFKVYNQSSGGALLWQENKLINVTSGLFSTLLGSNIAINLTFGEDYYVEMVVSGETFSPRYRVATSPYAFRANITTTAIAGTTTEPSFIVNSISGQVSNLTVWKNSTGTIVASLNTSGFFNVSGGIPCTAIRGGDGDFCADENATGSASDNTTQSNAITGNNNTMLANLGQKLNLTGGILSGLLSIIGINTANNLSLNVNNTFYVNASADRVGIGTAAPNQKLEVSGGNVNVSSGNLWVTGALVVNGTAITGTAAAGWTENTTTTTVFNDTPGVKVGIGTASPIAKLTVNGTNTANNLSLNINNTLYVNASADRVGIGISSPSQKLEISGGNVNVSSGNIWIEGDLIINGTPYASTNVSILYGANASNVSSIIPAQISSAGNLMVSIDEGLGTGWSASSGNVFTATLADKVGIGTSTPVSKLEISGNASISGTLLVNGVNISGGQAADNVTLGTRIDANNQTLFDKINLRANITDLTNANNTIYASLGQKLNLTGGTLSGLLGITGNAANAGNLSLSVNSTLYVNQSTSNVGIGTTGPSQLLSLNTASGNTPIVFTKGGTTAYGYIGMTAVNNYVVGAAESDMFMRSDGKNIVFSTDTGSSVQMILKNGGNVGIGTTFPQGSLDVNLSKSGGDVNLTIRNSYAAENATSENVSLIFGHAVYPAAKIVAFKNGDFFSNSPNVSGGLAFYTNNNGQSEKVRIAPNGNVGIGTTTPSGVLDLGSGTSGRALSWGGTAGSNNYVNIWAPYSGSGLVLATGMRGNTSNDGYQSSYGSAIRRSAIRLGAFDDNGIQFFTDGSATYADGTGVNPSERMRIDTNGNVGIGVTAPRAKLDVNGSLFVDSTLFDGADFSLSTTSNYHNYVNTGSTSYTSGTWIDIIPAGNLTPGTYIGTFWVHDLGTDASYPSFDENIMGSTLFTVSNDWDTQPGTEHELMSSKRSGNFGAAGNLKVRVMDVATNANSGIQVKVDSSFTGGGNIVFGVLAKRIF